MAGVPGRGAVSGVPGHWGCDQDPRRGAPPLPHVPRKDRDDGAVHLSGDLRPGAVQAEVIRVQGACREREEDQEQGTQRKWV